MARQCWLIGSLIFWIPCIVISQTLITKDEDLKDVLGNNVSDITQRTKDVENPTENPEKEIISIAKDVVDAIKDDKPKETKNSTDTGINISLMGEEIKKGIISKSTCVTCAHYMDIAKSFVKNRSDKQIMGMAKGICKVLGSSFDAKDPSVCDGFVESLGLDAIHAVKSANMSGAQMCGWYFGAECSDEVEPRHNWKISLPNTIKLGNHITSLPSQNYPKLKVLQITDIHYDPYYQEGSDSDCDFPLCCRESTGWPNSSETGAGKWGDYRKCDSPLRLIESAFQHIVDTHKDIDYILWTGDIPSHAIWNQSREENLENLRVISDLLAEYFGNITILPAVGNHESFPTDSFVPPGLEPDRNMSYLYDELAAEWSRWIPEHALETVKKGGYYSYLLRPGFRVLSVNGNYCGHNNFFLLVNSTDPYGQLAWLINELENAEGNDEKVHIINHVPPGQTDCLKTWSRNYYEIINRFEAVIMAQFYGHTHFDEFEVFYDTLDFKRPVNVAYIAPSITPWKNCNPAYRIYYVDGDHPKTTRAIIDFETWTMDLDRANRNNTPEWYKSYEAKSEYAMESLLPKDWNDLIRRMSENRTLFDVYHRNYYRDTPTMPECDEECRKYLLCNTLSGRSHDEDNLCQNLIVS